MTGSVILARLDLLPEAHVPTGRRSHSKTNYDRLATPVVFDKAGAQTVAAVTGRYVNTTPNPQPLKRLVANVGTAPTGATLRVDAQIDGTSVFSAVGAQVQVLANTKQAEAKPDKTGDDVVVRPGQVLTVSVTQVGSTVAGSDLRVEAYLGWSV